MAVRATIYLEIRVPLAEDPERHDQSTLDSLVEALISTLHKDRAGEFTGEEYGPQSQGPDPSQWTLFVVTKDAVRVLPSIGSLFAQAGLLTGSTAIIRRDVVANTSDLMFPLSDVDLWLEQVRRFATQPAPRSGRRPKVNDYYAIPLPDGRYGHAQYIHKIPRPIGGDLVQVLAVIQDVPATLQELVDGPPLFPPVMMIVSLAVRTFRIRPIMARGKLGRPRKGVKCDSRMVSQWMQIVGSGYVIWRVRYYS